MKLCEQRISGNSSLLLNKVCQIYPLRVRVSDNFTTFQRAKLSPPSPPPSFLCSRVTYVIVLKFGTRKPHPERNIQRMLFCSEMSVHLLTKYYIASFWSVIVKMLVLL